MALVVRNMILVDRLGELVAWDISISIQLVLGKS
jgi:hypothetical protein